MSLIPDVRVVVVAAVESIYYTLRSSSYTDRLQELGEIGVRGRKNRELGLPPSVAA